MSKTGCVSRSGIGWLGRAAIMIVVSVSFVASARAQSLSATAGLGLEYFNAPSLYKYLNFAAPGSMPNGPYQSAIQFVGGAEYFISRDWAVGLEYGYITKTVSSSGALGFQQIDFSYSMPSVTLRRVIFGEGYYIQFGGGVGYHFGDVNTTSPYSNQTADYSCRGVGLKLDALLDTKLGERLYARIDAEARTEFTGVLKAANGSELSYVDFNSGQSHSVDMSFGGVGITFGLVYYF